MFKRAERNTFKFQNVEKKCKCDLLFKTTGCEIIKLLLKDCADPNIGHVIRFLMIQEDSEEIIKTILRYKIDSKPSTQEL